MIAQQINKIINSSSGEDYLKPEIIISQSEDDDDQIEEDIINSQNVDNQKKDNQNTKKKKIKKKKAIGYILAFKYLRILERLGNIKSYFISKKNHYTVGFTKHLQYLMEIKIRDWPDLIFEKNEGSQNINKVLTKP